MPIPFAFLPRLLRRHVLPMGLLPHWYRRWPDDIRDEVLARLLALNPERANRERSAGQVALNPAKPTKRKKAKSQPSRGRLTLGFQTV